MATQAICPKCGGEYIIEDAARRVLEMAEQAAQAGILGNVREYAPLAAA